MKQKLQEILEPIDEPISSTRNGTPLSRYSEAIIKTFIRYGAQEAMIKVEFAEYSFNELYESLRNHCRKKHFMKIVRVHKQNGKLFLLRTDRK